MIGGENITDEINFTPTYEINTPLIDSVGFDITTDEFFITLSSGRTTQFKSSLEEYNEFILHNDKDKYLVEVLMDKIDKSEKFTTEIEVIDGL